MEEYCSGGDPFWYENDLQLAAELGKTLLERNKELEHQLKSYQSAHVEQQREIDLLTRQLEALRNVNDSRMRIYEEVDRNLQDLEKKNERLKADNKLDKDKIKRMNETIEHLELKSDELESKITELREQERRRKKSEKRTWSVPSLIDLPPDCRPYGYDDFKGWPSVSESDQVKLSRSKSHDPRTVFTQEAYHSKRPQLFFGHVDNKELKSLRETVRVLKLQLTTEHRQTEELHSKVDNLKQDKKCLELQLKDLQQEQDLNLNKSLTEELDEASTLPKRICRHCGSRLYRPGSEVDESEMLEHDIDKIPRGQLVRLKNGGSAYGSRESLNMIGLEAVTPSLESCGEILAYEAFQHDSDSDENGRPSRSDDDGLDSSVTLLGELEEQYRSLVKKYENLIDQKTKRSVSIDSSTQDNLDNVVLRRPKELDLRAKQQKIEWRKSGGLDLTSPVDPTLGHFDNGPPQYKELFKEIFQTLRRSVALEDEQLRKYEQAQQAKATSEQKVKAQPGAEGAKGAVPKR